MSKGNDLVKAFNSLNIPALNEKQGTVLLSLANEILFGGAAGPGKDICVETPILTTDGFKPMREVHVGDFVYDEAGQPTKVVWESEIFEGKKVYKVVFDDDTYILASSTHQWKTQTIKDRASNNRRTDSYRFNRRKKRSSRGTGKKDWLAEKNSNRDYVLDDSESYTISTTGDIKNTLRIKGKINHTINNTKAVNFTGGDLPVHPYVLGAWLGDGSKNQSYITNTDKDLVDYIDGLGYKIFPINRKYVYGIPRLITSLKKLGIADDKHIPDSYKFSSKEDRLELVRGLMDTDGTVSLDGCTSIGLSDKKLFTDLVFVLNSLGIKVKTKVKKTYLGGARKKDSYIAYFNTHYNMFHIKRKFDRQKFPKMPQYNYRYIKAVEEVPSVPTKCIQVDSPSHLFLAGKQLVPTHNSHALRVLSILYASMVPGLNVYLFRRLTEDLTKNHLEGPYGYPVLLHEWIQSGYAQIIYSSPKEVRFKNGSKIFLAHCQYEKDKYKYQGAEIHVLMMDEVTHFTATQYSFLRGRVRLGGLEIDPKSLTGTFNQMLATQGIEARFSEKQMSIYFPKIVCATNPGGTSHAHFKMNFVDAATPMQIWKTPDEQGGMFRQYIPAKISDNPVLLKQDPEYVKRLRGLGDPELARAMEEGDWDILSGGAFTGVWDEAVHFIEPFDIPETWRIDRSFDWGSAKPFSIGWWAESNGDSALLKDGTIVNFPKGTLFRINEYYGTKPGEINKGLEMSSFEIGQLLAKNELAMGISDRIKPGPADSSIFELTKFRDEYTSIADEVLSGYNFVYYPETKRKRGELFVPADKSPGSRIKGLEVVRTLLKNARKEPMEDKGLFIFNVCTDWKKTVPTLQRDERNLEDVDTDGADHSYDETRYRCMAKSIDIKKLRNFLA